MKIERGTHRIAFIFKNYVVKIPYKRSGIRAQREEAMNSVDNPYVAYTIRFGWIIIQERLYDTVIVPYEYVGNEYNGVDISKFQNVKKHNRIQIGRGRDGQYKFFDYEDVKYGMKK